MTVQSVERALKILELLYNCRETRGLSMTEISQMVKLKIPTTHNLLQTLVTLGYAEQNNDSRYLPGAKADKFGMKSDSLLLTSARPQIDTLVETINETALLAVYHDGIRYVLYQKECSRELIIVSSTAPNGNFYGTATGLAILSEMSDEQLAKFQKIRPDFLDHFPSKDAFLKTIEEVRRDHYCILEKGECIVFAIPLRCNQFGLLAAIGGFVPITRYNPATRKSICSAMQKCANAIKLCIS
ncbi:MAG: helix-turn-helix domain-containing protein [Lentisphaeria bacterium]